MSAADDITVFLCDQIGDRVRAILSTLPVDHEPDTPPIAGHRLLYCSGALVCCWSGPAPRRANPCSYQRALVQRCAFQPAEPRGFAAWVNRAPAQLGAPAASPPAEAGVPLQQVPDNA